MDNLVPKFNVVGHFREVDYLWRVHCHLRGVWLFSFLFFYFQKFSVLMQAVIDPDQTLCSGSILFATVLFIGSKTVDSGNGLSSSRGKTVAVHVATLALPIISLNSLVLGTLTSIKPSWIRGTFNSTCKVVCLCGTYT